MDVQFNYTKSRMKCNTRAVHPRELSCLRLTPIDARRGTSIRSSPRVHDPPTRLNRASRSYVSATSLHALLQVMICKHDHHRATVSSCSCRDVGHREASKVDSGISEFCQQRYPGPSSDVSTLEFDGLGSDLMRCLRDGGCAADAVSGSKSRFLKAKAL